MQAEDHAELVRGLIIGRGAELRTVYRTALYYCKRYLSCPPIVLCAVLKSEVSVRVLTEALADFRAGARSLGSVLNAIDFARIVGFYAARSARGL